MARVFDALQRAQKRKQSEGEHDPLAQLTGAPEAAPEVSEFELPLRIGAPAGPRSNEGMLLPGAARVPVETAGLPPPITPPALPAQPAALAGSGGAPISPPETTAQLVFQPPQTRAPERIARAQTRLSEAHPRLLMLHEPQNPACEQYRMLRTQIFHAAERQLTQVIVLTSTLTGEGKTATTLNLALAIAQSPRRRVLVIDGDLRQPNVATYLSLKPFNGFAEVLQERDDLFDALARLGDEELYVLPVKRAVSNPTELLSSPQFQAAVRELRQYFDFILIDSPPVKPFADARLLANQADAVLLVVRSGYAPYTAVEEAVQTLAGYRLLGVVLNGAAGSVKASNPETRETPSEPNSLLWSALAPKVRESWLGRRFKL